jgi:asparagine synthase (glutamine-hydrolysing)
MCGITGSFGEVVDPKIVDSLSDALSHRGPDGKGIWISDDRRTVFGHRRLSIIDVSSAGSQPMRSPSGRFVISFNGEIYNYKDIEKKIKELGWKAVGNSDTEVLLAAIDYFGIAKTLQIIDGMFAAAVYDRFTNSCYLFRDRLGVKPLYYMWAYNSLFFSSELTKNFAQLGHKNISRQALGLYFRHGYIPAPYSIYKDIYKLPPGTICSVSHENVTKKVFNTFEKYWDPSLQITNILKLPQVHHKLSDSVDHVEKALEKSIKNRIQSDVPIGVLFSGGVDSSLILSHMQLNSSNPVKTFTIGFNSHQHNEATYANLIAAHLKTDHNELIITEHEAINVIHEIPRIYSEPFADSSQIPSYLVSRFARQSVTVALSGDGGDELFAGYSSYLSMQRAKKYYSLVPSIAFAASAILLRKFNSNLLRNCIGQSNFEWGCNVLHTLSKQYDIVVSKNLDTNAITACRLVLGLDTGTMLSTFKNHRLNVVEQAMLNQTCLYLPDDILCKMDRASMACSLEIRAPFADDYNLFETAWSIPYQHKINESGGKIVLKEALARHIPRKLFERPKMGFAIPLHEWLFGPLRDWVVSCTDHKRIKDDGLLDSNVVNNVFYRAQKGCAFHTNILWSICVFQEWLVKVHK